MSTSDVMMMTASSNNFSESHSDNTENTMLTADHDNDRTSASGQEGDSESEVRTRKKGKGKGKDGKRRTRRSNNEESRQGTNDATTFASADKVSTISPPSESLPGLKSVSTADSVRAKDEGGVASSETTVNTVTADRIQKKIGAKRKKKKKKKKIEGGGERTSLRDENDKNSLHSQKSRARSDASNRAKDEGGVNARETTVNTVTADRIEKEIGAKRKKKRKKKKKEGGGERTSLRDENDKNSLHSQKSRARSDASKDRSSRIREKINRTNEAIAISYAVSRKIPFTNPDVGERAPGAVRHDAYSVIAPSNLNGSPHTKEDLKISKKDHMDVKANERKIHNCLAQNARDKHHVKYMDLARQKKACSRQGSGSETAVKPPSNLDGSPHTSDKHHMKYMERARQKKACSRQGSGSGSETAVKPPSNVDGSPHTSDKHHMKYMELARQNKACNRQGSGSGSETAVKPPSNFNGTPHTSDKHHMKYMERARQKKACSRQGSGSGSETAVKPPSNFNGTPHTSDKHHMKYMERARQKKACSRQGSGSGSEIAVTPLSNLNGTPHTSDKHHVKYMERARHNRACSRQGSDTGTTATPPSNLDAYSNDNLNISENDYMDAKASERDILSHLSNSGAIGAYYFDRPAYARQDSASGGPRSGTVVTSPSNPDRSTLTNDNSDDGGHRLRRVSRLIQSSIRLASAHSLPTLDGSNEDDESKRQRNNKRGLLVIVAVSSLLVVGGIVGAVLPTVLRKDEVIVEKLVIVEEVPVEVPEVEIPGFVGKSCSAEGSTEGGNSSSVALPIQRGRRRLSMFDDDEAWEDDEGGLRLRQQRLRLPSKRDLGKDKGGLRALQSPANATDESAQSPTNQEQPNKPTSYPTMGRSKSFFKGLAWYDRNANGKREPKMMPLGEDLEGEDVEYDYAVGGVEVRLVPCDEYTERSEFSEDDISKWNPTAKTGGYDGAGSPWLVPRRGNDINGRFDIFVQELDTYYFLHVTAPEGFLLTSGVCNDDVFSWDCEYKNAVAALSRSAESERSDIAIGVRTGRSPKCTKGDSKKAPLYFGVMRESDNKVLRTMVALVLKFDGGDLLEGGEEAAAIGTVTAGVLASELERRFAMDGTMELNSVDSRDVFLLKNKDANVAGNEISVVMDVKALITNFDTADVTRRLQDFDSGIDSTAFNNIIQDSINRDSAKIERNLKDFNLRCREQQSNGINVEDGDVFSTVCSENLVLPDYFETSLTEVEAKSVSEVDDLKCEVESRRLESIETTSSSALVQVASFVYCLVLMLGIMFMSI